MRLIGDWFRRHLSDPQVVGLALVLVIGFAIVVVMGGMLAPVIASVVIAYLLEGSVSWLVRWHCPRLLAVILVSFLFMAFLLFLMFALVPLLLQQLTQLFQQLPSMIAKGQDLLMSLPEKYPHIVEERQIRDLIGVIRAELATLGQRVLTLSLASVVSLITLGVYLVLMPLLVFFFLKDKQRLLDWVSGYLPQKRELVAQVWRDVNRQIANYVRGKFIEILIVWAVTYVTFLLMELQFSVLLSLLVGLSVLVPYVGAVAVTFPVALIAYFQWGFGPDMWWVMGAYTLIQMLDGNVLVPVLFSEVVNLHPVAIIVAILVFGGLWGFWGVFFAIPLATLVQAVLAAWPTLEPREPVSLLDEAKQSAEADT
ncbi:MAG: AI-2E family transporter [Gammaproteobacteria bacterium]